MARPGEDENQQALKQVEKTTDLEPFIIAESSVIEIEATERDYPVFLTVDGRRPVHLEAGSTVTVRKAAQSLPLAALPGVSFFSVVRQKLKWRGSNV